MATRPGGWGWRRGGCRHRILFPPAIIGSALVGCAVGAASGHLRRVPSAAWKVRRRKGWFMILRLYSPLASYFDKSWRPSEIEVVTGERRRAATPPR